MKGRFCPNCGRETEELVEGLCKECFAERKGWVRVPDSIEIKVCGKCGRKRLDKWTETSTEEAVSRALEDEINVDKDAEDLDIEINYRNGEAEVKLKGEVKGIEVEKADRVSVNPREVLCGDCKKAGSGYYEAVVQVRSEDADMDEILDSCADILEKDKKESEVVGFEKRKNGLDLRVRSSSAAKGLAKKLAEKYGAERKDSKTLKGLDEGKKVYRSTYLVRITNGS